VNDRLRLASRSIEVLKFFLNIQVSHTIAIGLLLSIIFRYSISAQQGLQSAFELLLRDDGVLALFLPKCTLTGFNLGKSYRENVTPIAGMR